MSITTHVTGETIEGNMRTVFGTFSNVGTSGTISTGLSSAIKRATVTGAETLTDAGGGVLDVTLPATATSGFWEASGDC
ncbi:hypothetical protein K9F62_03055 [Desulfovibrio sp. JY]|nr:hypothetical protein K9F62_03055 [Desulfovibrio sp. JY]